MTPDWALTLIYWTHMTATVIWIGGLTVLLLIILPLIRKTIPTENQVIILEQIQKRFDPISWLCLLLLVATGMFQMSANSNYEGLLAINNRWAVALLIKHVVFMIMIVVNSVITWVVLPKLRNVALKRRKGIPALEEEKLKGQETFLLGLNFVLGIMVLGLTALARIS